MSNKHFALAVASILVVTAPGVAQDAVKRAPLTAAEQRAVDNCLEIIRGCQLADGAFNMVNDGIAPVSPVWIAPYFVNHSMLALLAASNSKMSAADVTRVGKWLEWSVVHQHVGGFWHDFTGTIAAYKSNDKVDAHDSSAALFLMVAERYQRRGGKISGNVSAAAKSALKCIQHVTDTDGLTWAKPNYKVKFLMDNVEVYGGLIAGRKLFIATGDAAEAKAADKQAAAVGKGLRTRARFTCRKWH